MPPVTLMTAAGAGFLAAILAVSAATGTLGGIILANLAPLSIFVIGLGWGATAGVTAGLIATAAVFAIGGVPFALAFSGLQATPAALLSWAALRRTAAVDGYHDWPSGGHLVLWLCFLGATVTVVGAATLWGPTPPEQFLAEEFRKALSTVVDEATQERLQPALSLFAKLPALTVLSWMMTLASNGVLAQALLVRFDRQIRPAPVMSELALPRWFSLVGLALAVIAAAGPGWLGFIARNLLLVQGFAFVFAGLAVLHAASFRWRSRLGLLVAFYVAAFVFEWPFALAALIGLVEPWARLRFRSAGSGNDPRSEG